MLLDQLGIPFCSDGNYDEHLKKLSQMFSVTVKPPTVPVAFNFSTSSPILVTVFFICYPTECDVLSFFFFNFQLLNDLVIYIFSLEKCLLKVFG